MQAVHFGAGNIGRGFVGLLLHEAGYHVTFVDVSDELISSLDEATSYTVHEVGPGAKDHEVDNFSAINSKSAEADAVVAIAAADIVTCAVGPTVLKFIAPVIAKALAARTADAPLAVMACENAINATDNLRGFIAESVADQTDLDKAIFANTAVDRIVPQQPAGAGLDVYVEPFFEWAIESGPYGDNAPEIPGVHWVPDLAPYIERKLFTVNTGHATTAYFGAQAGAHAIAEALAIPEVRAQVEKVLHETKALIVTKHGFPADQQEEYLQSILVRFSNPGLTDTVERVGRQPLRKLSRHERFVGPAAELAELGLETDGLVAAMGAALHFDVPSDPQSVELQQQLRSLSAPEFVAQITGLTESDALYPAVLEVVTAAKA